MSAAEVPATDIAAYVDLKGTIFDGGGKGGDFLNRNTILFNTEFY